jgi:hypothetical protein
MAMTKKNFETRIFFCKIIIRNYTIDGKITIKMHMIIDIRFFFLKKDTSTRVQIINQKMKPFADRELYSCILYKRKMTTRQTMVDKILNRKLKIEKHKTQ